MVTSDPMNGTTLLVTGFHDGGLRYGLIRDGIYTEHTREVGHLDMDLLQLIDEICTRSPLNGIFVDRSAIRGFASIRLLLTTLNLIAWIKDIPIAAMDDYPTVHTDASFVDDVVDRIHDHPHFVCQLLPDYATPADITASKRSRKFTIS